MLNVYFGVIFGVDVCSMTKLKIFRPTVNSLTNKDKRSMVLISDGQHIKHETMYN